MKTIQFTGTDYEIDNLEFALAENDLKLKSETRVYVVNQEDSEKAIKDLTDEEFMDIAENWCRVYSLKGFQEIFNDQKDEVSHSEDFIRFINVIKFD